MIYSSIDNQLIKQTLTQAKTIAMIGVSFIKKEEISTSYKFRGMKKTEKQYLTINMKTKEPGLYNLSLTVTDLYSNQKVTKKRDVFITHNVVNYIY